MPSQHNTNIKQYSICQSAIELFTKQGFDNLTMADIAQNTSLAEAELYTYFGDKNDIILFLYQSINSDWELFVTDLPEKKLAERFEKTLIKKIELLQPYTIFLGNMMGLLLLNSKIGIQSARTSHIRTIGLQTIQKIIDGSSDSQSLKKKIVQLPSLLYIMHWAVLFVYIQTNDKEKTIEAAKLAAKMLKKAGSFSFLLHLSSFFNDISTWAEELLTKEVHAHHSVDREILKIIFNYRKTSNAEEACKNNTCETCMQMHEWKISYFTQLHVPVHFILPAFPAKSPNTSKVLGLQPDLGEKIALMTLEDMCKEIKSIYAPGANITICSDGRIFSELVGVTDEQISEYITGIKQLISNLGLQHVNIVNLEDLMEGSTFNESRNKVFSSYAEPLEELHDKIKTNPAFKELFNGIHRFITEDRKALQQEKSLNKIKEESKQIALKVLQHSNAWTRFLSYVFHDAVRLSIHPYPAHSDKIGIQLTRAVNNWITPWHGVVVLQEDGYLLMKKNEAEEKNARLVMENGQPYYYTLIP